MRIYFKLLLASLAIAYSSNSFSQGCAPCPNVFSVFDTTRCNTVDVVRNPTTPGPYTNSVAVRACRGAIMTYQINVGQPQCYAGITYTVTSVTNGVLIAASGNQFTVSWGTASSGSVNINFTVPAGSGGAPCTDAMILNFNLVASPVAAFTSSPQPACFNNPTAISFNSGASTNATGWFWDFGDGFNSTQQNPVHAYTSPGTYTVMLTVSNAITVNGQTICPTCSNRFQQTVSISALPGPPITCVASVCAGKSETYCTTAPGCTSFVWTVTGGNITGGQGTACVTVLWGSGNPQGTWNLVTGGACVTTYCSQGTTVNIPIVPASGTITGANLVCENTSAAYSLPAWPGTTYNWTLPAGGGAITPANTNTSQINVNWLTAGNYTVAATFFDSSLNCGGTASFAVNVRPLLSITGLQTYCAGQSGLLTSTRPGPVNINSVWSISPAGATIIAGNNTANVTILWSTPGNYVVTATPIGGGVCGPATYNVTVNPVPVISAITGPSPICAGGTNVYAAVSNLSGVFIWNVTNGTATTLGANNDSVQVVWAASGAYSLSVSQVSFPGNCPSNTFNQNISLYPTPVITGPASVCADAMVTYTITNIAAGNFNWFVTPPSFGTILSGQGTSSIQIKWHGNNNPGNSNIVYLHFGVCNKDSIAITINEPPLVNITPSGTLCSGGVTLSTGATGIFLWTGTPNPPPPPGTNPTISVTQPGTYNVQIQNYNGSGCTVTGVYTVPDAGRPVGSISADNILTYCLPSLPNLNLVAVNGPGYTFQWYGSPSTPLGTAPTQSVNNLTTAGSYSYYCVVSLGTCQVVSNVITITIQNCTGPGCTAEINETSIVGCNPFTFTITATQPAGSTITGTPAIYHYDDNTTIGGLTTHTFTSAGYQQVRICATVLYADNVTTCGDCKDVTVLVNAAPNFAGQVVCKKIILTDQSTTVSPTTISSYAWSAGLFPGNTPFPPAIGSFNANNIPNPVFTANVSNTYIISLTIVAGGCTMVHRDTFAVSVPDADFTPANSCAGTPVAFNNLLPAPTNFWSFGDAATSYTSPTAHAYASAGIFNVTHIVTDAAGCKDTVIKPITIVAAPICNIIAMGPTTFCFGDSVIFKACGGLTNIQWFNNGIAIPGAVNILDTVKQTGNYHFTALSAAGCLLVSDTVAVTVLQAPAAIFTATSGRCSFVNFAASVPTCIGCSYQWLLDGNPVSNTSQYSGFTGIAPLSAGPHNLQVIVVNALGCSATTTQNFTIFPNPTAVITVAGNPPLLCSNNVYTLSAATNAVSPAYAWQLGNAGPLISTLNPFLASAAENYKVTVTDGITGCTATAIQPINASPELNLFPIGCDTLCDTSRLFVPLASLNGNLAGYIINWYDNAPPYVSVGSGPSLNMSGFLSGNHVFSVIVIAPNNCADTSNIYSVRIRYCSGVVAVRGLDLTVRQKEGMAALQWVTENEHNNHHFVLERSADGIVFDRVVEIASQGDNAGKQYYYYNDPISVYNRAIYWRVRAVETGGREELSKIVRLDPVQPLAESISALPSITRGYTEILLQLKTGGAGNLTAYNSAGVAVKKLLLNLRAGANKVPLMIDALPPGMYVVTLSTATVKMSTRVIRN